MTSLLIYTLGFPASIHLSFDIIYKYYSLLEDIYACTSVIPTPLQRLCLLLWHAQAAFPNGPQLGPAGVQLGPNYAQLGPNWGPYGMLLGWWFKHASILFTYQLAGG